MKKRKPIAAILYFSVGSALFITTIIITTIIYLLTGKIHNVSDLFFALIISIAGILEGISGYVEYKRKQ